MTVAILIIILVVIVFWVIVIAAGVVDNGGVMAFFFGIFLIFSSFVLGVEVYEIRVTSSCEETLPRNQECVIIAVPKDIEE